MRKFKRLKQAQLLKFNKKLAWPISNSNIQDQVQEGALFSATSFRLMKLGDLVPMKIPN